MILSLSSQFARLSNVGGKGMNLARLAREGFPVPGGFIVATEAYRLFVEVNDLGTAIERSLSGLAAGDPAEAERVSREIRARFRAGEIPLHLEAALKEHHLPFEGTALAVRSSATAEDLPETSFAGQQDTFLNVRTYAGLREAVVECWSSLWTGRAIAYRARNEIPHRNAVLAVVVQELVDAEVSGVLFTANPLTGVRGQTVIDATPGLGEALVSGAVEPDHYVIDTGTLEIVDRRAGERTFALRPAAGGGVEKEAVIGEGPVLADPVLAELAALGRRVQSSYGAPQDIEFAVAGGRVYLLQSRPITTLYPLPDLPAEPLHVLFSFGSVQGMLDAMTPLGRDAIRLIMAGGARFVGYEVDYRTQRVLFEAGERLWANMTPVLRNSIGRRILPRAAGMIDPQARQILMALLDDERLQPGGRGMRTGTVMRLAWLALRAAGFVLLNMAAPERRRRAITRGGARILAQLGARARSIGGEPAYQLRRRAAQFRFLYRAFPIAIPSYGFGTGTGLMAFHAISRLAVHAGIPEETVHRLSRGLPHNVTTEMDLALWEAARSIGSNPEDREVLLGTDPDVLAGRYLEDRLPIGIQTTLGSFLERYGTRGVAEIDFGRPRWRERPAAVIRTLRGYLEIPEDQAPDRMFRRGAADVAAAADEIEAKLRNTAGGRFKAFAFRRLLKRYRVFGGMREAPKFFIIRMMGIMREALLESARVLVMDGVLNAPEDLFFLTFEELETLPGQPGGETPLKERVRARRERYDREMKRKQIPRILLSDGRVYYETTVGGESTDGQALAGSPVSPGVAEGVVRVVFDPGDSGLKPGEILVCRGTDPAWTPLFMIAAGLVMEVGGMMTHGAVVAREYGLPAVVGVARATERLETGMRVRVDGSSGVVEILDRQDPKTLRVLPVSPAKQLR